jgi:SAM-dependent methyltransferase
MGGAGTSGVDRKAAAEFAHRLIEIYGHATTTALIDLGYRLGLFEALRGAPRSSRELARRAKVTERYAREWLHGLAAAGIVGYQASTGRFDLPAERAECLAGGSPLMVAPGSRMVTMGIGRLGEVERAFRTGGGVPYARYLPEAPEVLDDLGRRRYDIAFVGRYLALAPGLPEALAGGLDVADWGCGSGHVLNLVARAYPRSRFTGLDVSSSALASGRAEAGRWGLRNVRFVRADPSRRRERNRYDMVLMLDTIHDQGDPGRWLRAARTALRPGGLLLAVEPRASSRLEDNVGSPEAVYLYGLSVLYCLPVSLAEGSAGLGTAWGTERALALFRASGFDRIDTRDAPMNSMAIVYLARTEERGRRSASTGRPNGPSSPAPAVAR